MVGGTTTDIDGRFNFEQLPMGRYTPRNELHRLRYRGTRTGTNGSRTLLPGRARRALGTGGQDLDEVVVTAERAVMELGLDRKVFNVEKSVAASGGSAEDLLRAAAEHRRGRRGKREPAGQRQRPLSHQRPAERAGRGRPGHLPAEPDGGGHRTHRKSSPTPARAIRSGRDGGPSSTSS